MMWILNAFALSHYGQVQQRQPFPDYSMYEIHSWENTGVEYSAPCGSLVFSIEILEYT